MKRVFFFTLKSVAAAALFVALVYAVLRVAHLTAPAASTTHATTGRRIWATGVVMLALASVVVSIVARRCPASRFNTAPWRFGMILAGMTAAVNGVLVLAFATAGPGSGNGVVGGAAALVLGLGAAAVATKELVSSRSSRADLTAEAQIRRLSN